MSNEIEYIGSKNITNTSNSGCSGCTKKKAIQSTSKSRIPTRSYYVADSGDIKRLDLKPKQKLVIGKDVTADQAKFLLSIKENNKSVFRLL